MLLNLLEETDEVNSSYSARVSQTVSNNTFWNLNLGYRIFEYQRYNPFLKGAENQDLYGDSLWWADESGMNVHLLGDGRRTQTVDENGCIRPYGYFNGIIPAKRRYEN